jgi:hypothetical protein
MSNKFHVKLLVGMTRRSLEASNKWFIHNFLNMKTVCTLALIASDIGNNICLVGLCKFFGSNLRKGDQNPVMTRTAPRGVNAPVSTIVDHIGRCVEENQGKGTTMSDVAIASPQAERKSSSAAIVTSPFERSTESRSRNIHDMLHSPSPSR